LVRLLIIALTLSAGLPMAWAEKFEARLSKSTVKAGETFQLSFTLTGKGKSFAPPSLRNFNVLMGPNESYQREWINGNFSSKMSYSYFLQASKEGSYEIGPASIKVNGKTLTTDPIVVKVVKGNKRNPATASNPQNKKSGAPQNKQSQDQSLQDQINANLFIKLFVDKKNAFVGEQIVATYKLYINAQVVDNRYKDLPVFNGFYAKDVEIPKGSEITTENINGKRFQVATLKRVVLFPQHAGELEIPELSMDMVVRVNERRRARTMFEQFMGTHRNVNASIRSNTEKITVEALPRQGQPADFGGAVGKYNISLEVDKESLSVNDALNLSVTISGKGNLDLITDPGIEFPGDFEAYDPELKSNIDVSPGGVSGKKTFEYVLIPRYAGNYSLEPISLSYFNPETGKYERTSTMPINLNVEKAAGGTPEAQAFAAPRKEDVQVLGKDIRFIQTGDPGLKDSADSFFGSPAFIALSVTPFAGMGLAVFLLSFFRVRQADVKGTRKRNAKGTAKRRLAKARKLLDADNEVFFDEIYRALNGYLADRFSLPQAELSRERITEVLTENNASETIITELKRCLEDCEMVRFAPGAVRGKSEALESAERVISELENELA